MNEIKIIHNNNTVEVELIPVETINYGFMGIQQYEGVEPIDKNKEG